MITVQRELDSLLLEHFPRQGRWSEDDYLWLTDSTKRLIEFTDGYLEVLPMPTDSHQAQSQFLLFGFLPQVQRIGGVIRYAPLRVRIRPRKFREPDLVLLLDANDPRRQDRYWLGADLVVEIVSRDKPERDLVQKRLDYAEAGILEYWIVNPLDHTVTVLRLDGDTYTEHGIFRRRDTATSVLLPSLTVDVTALFAAR